MSAAKTKDKDRQCVQKGCELRYTVIFSILGKRTKPDEPLLMLCWGHALRLSAKMAARETAERVPKKPTNNVIRALEQLGWGVWTTSDVAVQMGISPSGAYKQLRRSAEAGKILKRGNGKWSALTYQPSL